MSRDLTRGRNVGGKDSDVTVAGGAGLGERCCVGQGAPATLPNLHPAEDPTMQTTTMILGLIAATFLLLGGCSGFVFGAVVTSAEEAFDVEVDSEGSSPTEVQDAGSLAILVSFVLFVAGGLAKVALRTSLTLLTVCAVMAVGLISIDSFSLFAATYYLALLLTGTGCVLMVLAWRRAGREGVQPPRPP